jgi:hypothetical protein
MKKPDDQLEKDREAGGKHTAIIASGSEGEKRNMIVNRGTKSLSLAREEFAGDGAGQGDRQID